MLSYALKAKIPKNATAYVSYIKKELLDKCEKMGIDCVVEYLDGRILIFSDSRKVEDLVKDLRGYLSIHPIEIYDDADRLIDAILSRIKGCPSFAIRSNKKDVEREIGAKIVDRLKIPVNLSNPDCKVVVEKRGKFYLLFSDYP
jgi:tRNA(Ser,Leu) C12 N-acetylase TAN1